MITLLHGDCLDKLKELENNSVDSIVTDPPYELGFMGKSWDSTGIANNVDMWKECLRVLEPGGHLLAFSGTRTYHRMACAIEDAGFEVRDMIEWVYGSGFPKSLNIGKVLDKFLKTGNASWNGTGDSSNGALGYSKLQHKQGYRPEDYSNRHQNKEDIREEQAKQWEGWGTALKPAHEPICMARKPLSEKTVAENCLKWGTGGINVDESRVGIETITVNRHSGYNSNSLVESTKGKWQGEQEQVIGRFPANFIHDNSEEVRECFPEQKSSGNRKNVQYKNPNKPVVNFGGGIKNDFNDSGSASRFFKSIIYQAKASKSERNRGCEELEEKIQNNETTQSRTFNDRCLTCKKKFVGSDNTICHCPPELKITDKTVYTNKNNHPTVKPIALMEYLIKMVTPKNGIVLDPFMGSGSTGVACKKNDFSFIGIDMTADYVEIAKARIDNLTK